MAVLSGKLHSVQFIDQANLAVRFCWVKVGDHPKQKVCVNKKIAEYLRKNEHRHVELGLIQLGSPLYKGVSVIKLSQGDQYNAAPFSYFTTFLITLFFLVWGFVSLDSSDGIVKGLGYFLIVVGLYFAIPLMTYFLSPKRIE